MTEGNGILVIGELANGVPSGTTKELLAAAHHLAEGLGGQEVAVALLGSGLGDSPQDAINYGADKVYAVDKPILKDVQPDAYLAVFEEIARGNSPSVILGAKTNLGQDLMPRMAFRLGTALAQDCVEVSIEPGSQRLVAVRPVYGGNAMATVVCHSVPMMAVIRPKAYEPLSVNTSRQGQVILVEPNIDESVIRARVIERVEEKATGVRLEDAQIVIAGGRGLGGPEPFQQLEELADIMHAALGASRAVCDAGWVPAGYQIGLTGKTISPNLYITVAISGASQHMAGCFGAKNIVAINKDPDANIFKECRFGVVGDWKKVLSAFTEQVTELVQ